MLEESTDQDVLSRCVSCMIRLCRVHHELRDFIEVMQRLVCTDKVVERARGLTGID